MRPAVLAMLAVAMLFTHSSTAVAESCSERHLICQGACTPELVSSGRQYGGTVAGCRKSCRSRLNRCLRTGIWVHMGARNRGLQQKVDRR